MSYSTKSLVMLISVLGLINAGAMHRRHRHSHRIHRQQTHRNQTVLAQTYILDTGSLLGVADDDIQDQAEAAIRQEYDDLDCILFKNVARQVIIARHHQQISHHRGLQYESRNKRSVVSTPSVTLSMNTRDLGHCPKTITGPALSTTQQPSLDLKCRVMEFYFDQKEFTTGNQLQWADIANGLKNISDNLLENVDPNANMTEVYNDLSCAIEMWDLKPNCPSCATTAKQDWTYSADVVRHLHEHLYSIRNSTATCFSMLVGVLHQVSAAMSYHVTECSESANSDGVVYHKLGDSVCYKKVMDNISAVYTEDDVMADCSYSGIKTLYDMKMVVEQKNEVRTLSDLLRKPVDYYKSLMHVLTKLYLKSIGCVDSKMTNDKIADRFDICEDLSSDSRWNDGWETWLQNKRTTFCAIDRNNVA